MLDWRGKQSGDFFSEFWQGAFALVKLAKHQLGSSKCE